ASWCSSGSRSTLPGAICPDYSLNETRFWECRAPARQLSLQVTPPPPGFIAASAVSGVTVGRGRTRRSQPLDYPFRRHQPTGKTRSEQVTASGSFPVEHFAGTEYARQTLQHQALIQRLGANAAGAADGFVQRPGAGQPNGQSLDAGGQ